MTLTEMEQDVLAEARRDPQIQCWVLFSEKQGDEPMPDLEQHRDIVGHNGHFSRFIGGIGEVNVYGFYRLLTTPQRRDAERRILNGAYCTKIEWFDAPPMAQA